MAKGATSTLAIDGGAPVRDKYLPFHRPLLGEEEEKEVIDALRSGWITTGPKTRQFERQFAEYVGAPHAVATNSCTAALHLALIAGGVRPGDEVITSPITFASTANVIIHAGATPVFVDVEPDTLNMDASKLASAVSGKTRAIIPVHFAGNPCDMEAIQAIASPKDILVVEDAAHATGARYRDRPIGAVSKATCFSFYATKNITTGEGGMLTTADAELAERVAILSLHGISADAWKRYAQKGYQHWEIVYPGYKYNMSDLQAALGLCQLKKADSFWMERRRQVDFYNEAFADLPEVVPLAVRPGVRTSYHLYVIQLQTERLRVDRDTFIRAMEAENIGIGIHFRAVHLHPYYRQAYGFGPGLCPVAERASERVMSLPLFPGLARADQELVVEAVRKLVGNYRRTE